MFVLASIRWALVRWHVGVLVALVALAVTAGAVYLAVTAGLVDLPHYLGNWRWGLPVYLANWRWGLPAWLAAPFPYKW
jgi:hypothetical protein